MVTEQRREERAKALQSGIDAANLYSAIGQRTFMKWTEMAHHTLHVDIEDGEKGDQLSDFYNFTPIQQNRLIAHARQDAAHAVFGVHDAFQEARMSRRLSAISVWLNVIMLGILIFVVFL